MRRFFIFIVFALCSFWQLRAQADTASFLFDKYEDAQVVLRAGGELKSKMNKKRRSKIRKMIASKLV